MSGYLSLSLSYLVPQPLLRIMLSSIYQAFEIFDQSDKKTKPNQPKKNNRKTKFMKSLVRWDIRVLRFMRVHLSEGLTATPDHISTIYIPLFYHQRQGQRQRQRQRQRQEKDKYKDKD